MKHSHSPVSENTIRRIISEDIKDYSSSYVSIPYSEDSLSRHTLMTLILIMIIVNLEHQQGV